MSFFRLHCAGSILMALWVISATALGQEAERVNVLRLPSAKLEVVSVTGGELASLAALADGDPTTVAEATAQANSPLTIVFGFGDATVAIEELVITLTANSESSPGPSQVDLLVSTLSPHAGFQSVRTDSLTPTSEPQSFSLRLIAAKWIMLRLTPLKGAKKVTVSELAVLGREGTPATHYQFKESPAKAFDLLRKLDGISAIDVALTPDEISLFADARDGKFDQWTFDEAALMAAGVVDAMKRKAYLNRLDEIERDARKATKGLRTPFEKGRALLRYLHEGPMSNGYASEQTDVSLILDSGRFNCVSSATLYNMIGRRLGLDCRGVEVPQHAFSIVYAGVAHADVETTTVDGFDPARDEAAQADFEKLTGFTYIPESNRDQRREISDVGLVAITYYNHGVTLSNEKRFHEALLAYFRAMSLDMESDSAVKNALAVLANWSLELADGMKYEDALQVLAAGLDLAPEDATLVNNRQAVWNNWALSLMEAGRNDEAIDLLKRAAQQIPDGGFLERQAWVFMRRGEEHIKAGEWEQALALVIPGLEKLEGVAREEFAEWSSNLHHRWAQSEEKEGHYDLALDVIEKALATKPDDAELVNHLAYIVQEWGRAKQQESNEQAIQLMADLLTRFSRYEEVREVAESFAFRSVNELVEDGKYDEALTAAERLGGSLKDPQLALSLSRAIVDRRADALATQEKWHLAIDIYVQSLQRFPGDEHLSNNLRAMWSRWASSFQDKSDWGGALGVFETQQVQMPGDATIENNIRFDVQEWLQAEVDTNGPEAAEKVLAEQLVRFKAVPDIGDVGLGYFQRLVRELAEDKKYDDALAAAERAKKLLPNDLQATELSVAVFDIWAASFADQDDWPAAVGVYAEAIEKFPRSDHLQQNAVATWDQWAKTLMEKGDWAGAADVYEKALLKFPENSTLKNNLEYCREKVQ